MYIEKYFMGWEFNVILIFLIENVTAKGFDSGYRGPAGDFNGYGASNARGQ